MKTLSEIIYGLNPLKLVGDANVVVSGVQSDSRKVEAGFFLSLLAALRSMVMISSQTLFREARRRWCANGCRRSWPTA